MIRSLRLDYRYGGLPMVVANRLPRRVVYWAAIRLMAHATQGRWSSQNVPALRATDALQRWDEA